MKTCASEPRDGEARQMNSASFFSLRNSRSSCFDWFDRRGRKGERARDRERERAREGEERERERERGREGGRERERERERKRKREGRRREQREKEKREKEKREKRERERERESGSIPFLVIDAAEEEPLEAHFSGEECSLCRRVPKRIQLPTGPHPQGMDEYKASTQRRKDDESIFLVAGIPRSSTQLVHEELVPQGCLVNHVLCGQTANYGHTVAASRQAKIQLSQACMPDKQPRSESLLHHAYTSHRC